MFVLILAAFSLVADAAITLTPVNQVKVVGHQTVFNCSTSGSTTVMRWRLESANGSPTCTVMVGTTVGDCAQSRFSVSQSATGPYNLIINDTSLSDAGTYACDDVSATTVPPVSAIYGVIEPNLAVGLSVNETCLLEGETEILTCKVTYKGSNLMPLVMTWTNSSGQTVPSNSTYNTANGLFQSTTYVTAGKSYIQPFTCSVNFTAPTGNTSQIVPTPVQATNPPSYTNTTTSPPYNVQLCPRMINITFSNGTEFPGGEVTVITILHCSVSGGGVYINTVYNWTETGRSYYIGPNTTIPYGKYSLTCTATSSLCGTKFCPTALNKTVTGYSNALITATSSTGTSTLFTAVGTESTLTCSSCCPMCPKEDDYRSSTIALGVMFGLTSLSTIALAVVVYFQHRKLKGHHQSNGPTDGVNEGDINFTDIQQQPTGHYEPIRVGVQGHSVYQELDRSS